MLVKAVAPAKVILLGDHTFFYKNSKGEYNSGVTIAINKKSRVSVEDKRENIEVLSDSLGETKTREEIKNMLIELAMLRKTNKLNKIVEMVEKDFLLPSFVVIGKIFEKYGYRPIKVKIKTEVDKGLGASASVFSALSCALMNFLKVKPDLEEIANFAKEGDNVAHGTTSGIDAFSVTYGYWNVFKLPEGIKRLKTSLKLPLVIVNSGKKAKTFQSIMRIMEIKRTKPNFMVSLIDKLNEISISGLEALESGNLERLGKCMTDYHFYLSKTGISTKELDDIVDVALKNGALGAKMTGAGNGGCCIVLAKDMKHVKDLITVYKKKGYNAYKVDLGVEGVRLIK